MLRSRFALALAGLFVAATPAAAQPAEGGVVKKEGDYGGVTPGQAPAAEKGAKPRRPPARKSLNWVGFAPKDGGGSELFFQAVDDFTVSQRMEGSTLVVTLAGLSKQARNTKRPLDTRFFDTAVARVTTKVGRRKKGIEVRVAFKDPKDAREGSVRTDKGADGMFYAYLSFAPPATPGQIPDNVDRPRAGTTSSSEPE
ncbi:MAG TPA: hypothetical protein VM261_17500 [Kofleriaceae bacterium]|nr:hypothetical protein [Kofleriaceae bacterium]